MKKYLIVLMMALFIFSGITMAAVNVNTASKAELMKLPGIGDVRAEAIIDYRKAHGDFNSLQGLAEVKGIGEATVEELKGEATTGSSE